MFSGQDGERISQSIARSAQPGAQAHQQKPVSERHAEHQFVAGEVAEHLAQ